jgi:trehalose synthase
VLQVSRWDRLKDPLGLVQGFAQSQGQAIHQSSLMLAGPSSRSTQDDPEDTQVYRSLVEIWRSLPEKVRSRIYLVSVPMVDIEENAAVINALQRHATVVVQKSISEGFGLTVTEALWKSRPVIASAVGGIQDQIDNGVDGMLLHDPHDLSSFGKMLETLLSNSQLRKRLGENGHNRVASHYLGIDSLLHYGSLIENIDSIGAKEIA